MPESLPEIRASNGVVLRSGAKGPPAQSISLTERCEAIYGQWTSCSGGPPSPSCFRIDWGNLELGSKWGDVFASNLELTNQVRERNQPSLGSASSAALAVTGFGSTGWRPADPAEAGVAAPSSLED